MAEEKAEHALDHALDGERLTLASRRVRDELCPRSGMRRMRRCALG